MITLVTVIHVIACLFLMLVVLLQAGKGGGMGVAFGSSGGGSQVFGGRGAGGFLEKLTAGTAVVFMLTSVTLAAKASHTESTRLQELSDRQKKEAEVKKAEQARKDKEAEEAARKALDQKAKSAAPEAPAPAPAAPAPAPAAPSAPAPAGGHAP